MRSKILSAILAAGTMLLLILDTKTAITGAAAGIALCIKVLVPSLFPFFVVSTYLNAAMMGLTVPGLRALGKALHLPAGGDSMLLLGLIGGYPVGAQLIGDAYEERQINKRTGRIMLGYCSNAGPAFIFGVTSTLFSSASASFLLWGIHILSALGTAFLLPRPKQEIAIQQKCISPSIVASVKKSTIIMASVCGWVVIFKIILSYLQLWIKNSAFIISLSGILEISNGCLLLAQIPGETGRFILCSAYLALGGICVLMQTASVTGRLGLGLYIPGKLMQTSISILFAIILSFTLYPRIFLPIQELLCGGGACIVIIMIARKYAEKVVEIP